MALVELRGPVEGRVAPDGLEVPADLRAQEAVIRRLQLLDGGRVPPHHDVGIAPEARDVVEATHDDALLGDLAEERLELGERLVPVVAQGSRGGEDRPHRVADGLVDLAHLRRGQSLAHDPIIPTATEAVLSGSAAPVRPHARRRCTRGCPPRRMPPRPG